MNKNNIKLIESQKKIIFSFIKDVILKNKDPFLSFYCSKKRGYYHIEAQHLCCREQLDIEITPKPMKIFFDWFCDNFNRIFSKEIIKPILVRTWEQDYSCGFSLFFKNKGKSNISIEIPHISLETGELKFVICQADTQQRFTNCQEVEDYVFKEFPELKINLLKQQKEFIENNLKLYKKAAESSQENLDVLLKYIESLPDEEKLLLKI